MTGAVLQVRFYVPELIRSGVWQPVQPGIEAHVLSGGIGQAGSTALLRYRAGARLTRHRHLGVEQILVLSGDQLDERGRYDEGSLVLNLPGSVHSVHSQQGCIVLVTWFGSVVFE